MPAPGSQPSAAPRLPGPWPGGCAPSRSAAARSRGFRPRRPPPRARATRPCRRPVALAARGLRPGCGRRAPVRLSPAAASPAPPPAASTPAAPAPTPGGTMRAAAPPPHSRPPRPAPAPAAHKLRLGRQSARRVQWGQRPDHQHGQQLERDPQVTATARCGRLCTGAAAAGQAGRPAPRTRLGEATAVSGWPLSDACQASFVRLRPRPGSRLRPPGRSHRPRPARRRAARPRCRPARPPLTASDEAVASRHKSNEGVMLTRRRPATPSSVRARPATTKLASARTPMSKRASSGAGPLVGDLAMAHRRPAWRRPSAGRRSAAGTGVRSAASPRAWPVAHLQQQVGHLRPGRAQDQRAVLGAARRRRRDERGHDLAAVRAERPADALQQPEAARQDRSQPSRPPGPGRRCPGRGRCPGSRAQGPRGRRAAGGPAQPAGHSAAASSSPAGRDGQRDAGPRGHRRTMRLPGAGPTSHPRPRRLPPGRSGPPTRP